MTRYEGQQTEFLEAAPSFVPQDRKVQLILDAADSAGSLVATASSPRPSWGLQMFAGADVFANPARAEVFRAAVERMRKVPGH
jgi:hypothetical protein